MFGCVNLCSGDYGPNVDLDKLKDFHRRRLQVLVEAGPDLLAFETIPNKLEAQVCAFTNLMFQRDNKVFDVHLISDFANVCRPASSCLKKKTFKCHLGYVSAL